MSAPKVYTQSPRDHLDCQMRDTNVLNNENVWLIMFRHSIVCLTNHFWVVYNKSKLEPTLGKCTIKALECYKLLKNKYLLFSLDVV